MHDVEHVTPAGVREEGRAANVAADVVRDGWSLVGALDGTLTRRLRGAVDEVAARCADAPSSGQLHLLSVLGAEIVHHMVHALDVAARESSGSSPGASRSRF